MKMTDKGYSPAEGYLTDYVRRLPLFHDTQAEHLIGDSARKYYEGVGPPLISPVTEYGERIVLRVMEYHPLLDSSNIAFDEWRKMAHDITKYYDDFDSFVILHGTDTMSWTASALSFMLENLDKTVCITGSQIPLCRPRNDGIQNLLGAINIAGHFDIPEVVVYFGFKLFRGCRTSKLDANGFTAFDSPNCSPLATVGVNIKVNWDLIQPRPHKALALRDNFCNDITLLRIFPGPFNTLEATLKDVKGLVLQTFGSGNAPQLPHFLDVIKRACDKGVVVLNCTQCIKGEVEAHYAAGYALREVGVVSCGDMTPEASLIKLGWLLGSGISPDEVRAKIQKDLRGERKNPDKDNVFRMQDKSFAKAVYNVLKKQDSDLVSSLSSGTANVVSKIDMGLLPIVICEFAAMGATDELNSIYKDRNSESPGMLSPDVCDYDQRTGLHLSAANDRFETVQFFLEQGADVNVKDAFGRTPLREAAAQGHKEIIKLLRQHGAGIGMDDSEIAVTLCSTVARGDKESVQNWIDAGVNVNGTDYTNHTPLMVARASGQPDIAQLLVDAGATS